MIKKEKSEEKIEISTKYCIESNLYHCGITLFTNRILLYAIGTSGIKKNSHWIKILDKKNEKLYEQQIAEVVEKELEVIFLYKYFSFGNIKAVFGSLTEIFSFIIQNPLV